MWNAPPDLFASNTEKLELALRGAIRGAFDKTFTSDAAAPQRKAHPTTYESFESYY
jgi:hypothetical protein